MKIFIDSDVIISSLLSPSGAAYMIINHPYKQVDSYISNFSLKEIKIVAKELKINQKKIDSLLKKIKTINLELNNQIIKKKYHQYTNDINDAHIVAAAHQIKARFLVSYNLKDYFINRIKKDLEIIVLSPGFMLQYLRSV